MKRNRSDLSVEVVTEEKRFNVLCEEWNGLAAQAGVHIFQTYEWQRTWWKYFGAGKQLHILLFRNANQLIGIMPFFLDTFRVLGFTVYRCLKLIGSKVMQPAGGSLPAELAFGDYLNVIVHPGYVEELMAALKIHLETHRPLYDEIIFEEIPATSPLLSLLAPQLTEESITVSDASVCLQIRFPASWEELLAGLSRSTRRHLRRSVRRVTRRGLFELHTAHTDTEVIRAFEFLVASHQQRWQRLGHPGIFADKRVYDFFRELTLYFHKKDCLWIRTATVQSQCVAADLMFKYNRIIYRVQVGFDETSPYSRYGPGNVLLYCSMKEAIDNGFEMYDFLRGEEKYKLKAAKQSIRNKNIIIQNIKRETRLFVQLSKMLRSYARLKRKLRKERIVFGIYFDRQNVVAALGKYASYLYHRVSKKVNELAKPDVKQQQL